MVSAAYKNVELPNSFQKLILCCLGFILPPLPVFLLTAPNYTIFTTEFLVSVILTLLAHVPGVLFSIYFVLIEFPRSHSECTRDGYIRIEDEPQNQPQPPHHPQHQQQPEPHHEQAPPKYDDVVSPGFTGASDSKHSDNKVQH